MDEDVKRIFIKMFWCIVGFFITQIPAASGIRYNLKGAILSFVVAFAIGLLLDHIFTDKFMKKEDE